MNKKKFYILIQGIIITVLYILISELLTGLIFYLLKDNATQFVIHSISSVLIMGLIFLLYFSSKKEYNLIRVSESKVAGILLPASIGLLFVFFQYPLNIIYNVFFSVDYHIDYVFSLSGLNNKSIILTLCILPLTEELLFRGVILYRLMKVYSRIWSILISAILFAIIHLPIAILFVEPDLFNFHRAFIAFFGGLIAGGIYVRSGILGYSILFHVFWNLGVIIF